MEKVMFNKHLTPTQNKDVGAMELNKIQLFTFEAGKVSEDNTHDLTNIWRQPNEQKLILQSTKHLTTHQKHDGF